MRYTVEPLNKGRVCTLTDVYYLEVVLFWGFQLYTNSHLSVPFPPMSVPFHTFHNYISLYFHNGKMAICMPFLRDNKWKFEAFFQCIITEGVTTWNTCDRSLSGPGSYFLDLTRRWSQAYFVHTMLPSIRVLYGYNYYKITVSLEENIQSPLIEFLLVGHSTVILHGEKDN